MPFFRDGVPLQITVLTAFLLIYIPAVTLIVYYNHMTNRERAEGDVSDQIELMSARIVERQQRFFQPAADWAAIWAKRMALLQSPVAEVPKNLPSALENLARNPQFYSVLVGTGPGGERFEVFQVSRVVAGGNYGVNPADLPGDVQYASWLIDRVRGQPERREFFDSTLRPVMKATVEPTKLVLWTRPWYKIAQEQTGVAMEGPFLFGSGQRMGISFSHRFVGAKQQGAVAVTVLLSEFAEFLQQNRVGKGGYSVVFDQQGRVIALGDPTGKALAAFTKGQGEQRTPLLAESNIPALGWLNNHLPKNGERREEYFTAGGHRYKVLMVPLRSPFKGDLHLGLVVSMEEFLNPIYRETAITAIISMAIALAAVPFIFWLAF
ncbi:MAG TPA: cache domain-containing protein, partial [bacterium]